MNQPRFRTFNSNWRALTLGVGATILFAPLATGQTAGIAESPRGQAGAENYKLRVNSNLVFLPTRVQSRKGETIYGLQPEDFIVEDDGVRQSVQR